MLSNRLPLAVSLMSLVWNVSYAASNSCHNVKNFTQLVDHANGPQYGNATFPQQYQLDTSAYKPGGPILFFQGNEGVQMFCVEQLILPNWAKELGAAVATLEHRFFGESVPSNATDPIERFKTLTLDNVMMDSVKFIEWVKCELPGGKDSKTLVQGASYGASLSSWLRLNHPDTFYGAISSAPALRGFGYEQNDRVNYNWQNWVSSVYSRQSAEAASKIKTAFLELESRIATEQGRAGLQSEFNLCSPVTNQSGVFLTTFIQTCYSFATQFNFGAPQYAIGNSSLPVGYPFPTPLNTLINRTLATNDSLQVLNASLSLYMDQFPGCVNYTLGAPQLAAIETSVFDYIICGWLSFITSATDNATIFLPIPVEASLQKQHCKKQYNIDVMSQAELQRKYRFSQQDIENSTRLLITSGEFDPTSSVAPLAWDYSADVNASRIMYVSEMAHCEDTYKSRQGDKESVIRARDYELQIIKGWLGY